MMKLPQPKVPEAFLHALPDGITFIQRQGQEFLVIERVCCPAGHNLIDDAVRIHGQPSIRIEVDTGASRGRVYVDAFWGGHDKLYDFIPVITPAVPAVTAFCPHCGVPLITERACPMPGCGCTTSILFTLPDQRNRIQVCARLGCSGHHIELADLPGGIAALVDDINFFTHNDDLFQGI